MDASEERLWIQDREYTASVCVLVSVCVWVCMGVGGWQWINMLTQRAAWR